MVLGGRTVAFIPAKELELIKPKTKKKKKFLKKC
jgi:hypothetical protein